MLILYTRNFSSLICVAQFTGGTRPPDLFRFTDSEADGRADPRAGCTVGVGKPVGVDNSESAGGASGSGSGLTLKGKLLMDAYDQFAEHLNREAQALYGKFFNSLVEVT